MRRYSIRLAFLALGSLVAVAAAQAQQGGSAIRGRITDQQQGILPGVAIVVTHTESGTIREIVENLESQQTSLEQSIALFERGMKLSKRCSNELGRIEKNIHVILENSKGDVELKPFETEEE